MCVCMLLQFLLEGLREVQQQLQQQGVPLLVLCEGLGQDTTSTSNAATTTSSSSSTGGWWGSAAASAGVAAADGLEPQVGGYFACRGVGCLSSCRVHIRRCSCRQEHYGTDWHRVGAGRSLQCADSNISCTSH
jgi:hypothetical protein